MVEEKPELESKERRSFRAVVITSMAGGLAAVLVLLVAFWRYDFMTDSPLELFALVGLFIAGAIVGPFLFFVFDSTVPLFHWRNRRRMLVGFSIVLVVFWLIVLLVNYDGSKLLAMKKYNLIQMGMPRSDVINLMNEATVIGGFPTDDHGYWNIGRRCSIHVYLDSGGLVTKKCVFGHDEYKSRMPKPVKSVLGWFGIMMDLDYMQEP